MPELLDLESLDQSGQAAPEGRIHRPGGLHGAPQRPRRAVEVRRALLARTPPTLRCPVTSRQKLLIEGEQEFPLTPLATPSQAKTPAELLDTPSVALFVDRAQTVKPDFQLTERNASVVAELCAHLEGIPLALELAAARLQLLSPARILEHISANRLDFLSTRRRDVGSRHRTLRTTLDWSYHLLPPSAQAFLMQSGVFRGGWTLEAAKSVCQIKHGETLEMLGLLRDNSLVSVVDTKAGVRFRLLETVREYACEQLEQTGQEAAVRRRHRDYFLELAVEADKNLSGSEQKDGFECLEAENANLRAALTWSLQNGDAESSALQLCDALWQFWQLRGYWREGREQLERALRQEGAEAPISLRSSALDGAGALARMQEDFEAARSYFEESLMLRKELGDKRKIAASLNNLGVLMREQGYNADASLYLEEALALNREIGNRAWEAANLNNLARIFDNQDNVAAAQSYFEQALVINREVGNRIWEADDLQCLGNLARQQGRYPEARFYLEEALAINREISGRVGEAGDLELLGRVADDEGDHDQARAYLEEALAINREIGAPISELRILQMLGRVEREQSHSILAAAFYEQASALCRAVRNPAWEAFVLIERGHLAAKSQETAQAQSLFQQAMHLFQKDGSSRRPDDGLETVAEFLEALVCLSAEIEPSSWGVRLLAGITAQRALRGKPLPPGRRSEIERSLALLRTALGDEIFDITWAEGTALTLEEVIACVRKH
jgi:predicted ATPase